MTDRNLRVLNFKLTQLLFGTFLCFSYLEDTKLHDLHLCYRIWLLALNFPEIDKKTILNSVFLVSYEPCLSGDIWIG